MAGRSQGPASATSTEQHGSEEVRSLSRKIKSCEACRKMKIKCIFVPGATICNRCQTRNLQCKLNKNIQGILEDDLKWKHDLEATLRRQQDQISALQKAVEELTQDSRLQSRRVLSETHTAKRRRISQSSLDAPGDGLDNSNDEGASHLGEDNSQSILPRRATRQREIDIISRDLISLDDAVSLLSLYLSEMDVQLFHIIRTCHISDPKRAPGTRLQQETVREWLDELRNSSSLLLLSLLSVAALHAQHQSNQPHKFPVVYKEFVRLAAAQAFSQQHTLDDLRALVIGAFYLSDVSWILVGIAVRVATEQGLHLSYKVTPLAPNSGASQVEVKAAARSYEEARLYYLVYLVDHQASITPHGRPPMTRQHSGIRNCSEWLLKCCHTNGVRLDDQRLISQVKLFEILHDTVDLMGTDATQPLDAQSFLLEQRFSNSLREWSKESSLQISWSCSGEEEKERYQSEVRLHFSFAFLFLESFAFRAPPGTKPFIPTEGPMQEMASRAETTAHGILEALANKSQHVWSSIRYGPAYLYSMVISTIVFVVKVQESKSPEFHSLEQTLDKVKQALNQARKLANLNSDQHLMRRFANRSEELIRTLSNLAHQNSVSASSNGPDFIGNHLDDFTSLTSSLNTSGVDSFGFGSLPQVGGPVPAEIPGFTLDEFDLLSNTHPISGLNLSDIFESIDMGSANGSSFSSISSGNL